MEEFRGEILRRLRVVREARHIGRKAEAMTVAAKSTPPHGLCDAPVAERPGRGMALVL